MGCPQTSAPLFGTRSSTFPALAWEERVTNGASQEFLLDCSLSGPSSPPLLLLLLLPVVWVPRSPHLLEALPQVLKMHVVTVTLACTNVALSSESRAHKEGVEQRDGAKPGQHNRAGLSACRGHALLFGHVPLCLQPRCCRKCCKGPKWWGMVLCLPSHRCQSSSGWKEDMFLKPQLAFAVVQRASPILATSFG